jgi:sugar lactone lactonase YvrE
MDEAPPAWPKRKLSIFALIFVAIAAIIAITVVALGARYKSQLRPNREQEFALPFNGLHDPRGVAVDAAGNVYVVDSGNSRVVKLAAGSSAQTVLPFNGLADPSGVAVDTAGNLYVSDPGHDRVVKLAAGSSTQTVLPSTGGTPDAVAVDTAGAVYTDVFKGLGRSTASYLLRLAAGSDTWTTLPSAGVEEYAAVDTAGNVYVVTRGDDAGVTRLAPGSSSWIRLPGAYDFRAAGGLAVDARGNVYVTDNLAPGRGAHSSGLVVKLPAG